MRTLDEIIQIFEAFSNKRYDLYEGLSQSLITDTLYYLNTIETTENLYHDAVNELSKWKDEDWKDRYLPLTWDELKQMKGKPVWLEYNYHISNEKFRGWCIISEFNPWRDTEFIITNRGFVLSKNEQDIYWKTYKKERK